MEDGAKLYFRDNAIFGNRYSENASAISIDANSQLQAGGLQLKGEKGAGVTYTLPLAGSTAENGKFSVRNSINISNEDDSEVSLVIDTAQGAATNMEFDGSLNIEEYIADTDAGDSNDVFEIDGLVIDSPAEITFDTSSERIYAVDYNEALVPNPQDWTLVSNGVLGTDGPVTVIDPAVATQHHYRVRVSIP